MLVAITVVPAACAHIDFNGKKKGARGPDRNGGLVVGGVKWLLGGWYRSLACILVIAGASAAVIVYLTPPAEYLPEGDEPKVFARMNAPPGYNLVTMRTIGKELQDELLPFVNDDPARFKRGETDVPALKYLFMRVTPEGLRIISETVDPNDIDALMAALTAKYQKYPGMRAFATRGSIITSNDAGTRSVSLDTSSTTHFLVAFILTGATVSLFPHEFTPGTGAITVVPASGSTTRAPLGGRCSGSPFCETRSNATCRTSTTSASRSA